jgi:glycosyltransferase involved in cell wall biosynthesis
MKKFVYVLNSYSDNDAGHYKHIINLLNEISKRNIDVALFIENLRDVPTQLDPNIQVFGLRNYRNIVFRTIDTLFLIIRLYRRGYKLFFVRISKYPAIMALLIRIIYPDLRIYFWLSGQGMFEKYRAMNFGLRKCRFYFLEMLPFTIISKMVTKFVTGPESMHKYFVNHGVPDNKVLIMYNDIDINYYRPVYNLEMKLQLRTKFCLPLNKEIILFVHRFSPVRKTSIYLENLIPSVLNKFEECVFVFVGDGPDLPKILNIFKDFISNGRCVFLGAKVESEVLDLYQLSDIFINPTYSEGFPRVILEAMACGLPIVTTDAGGIKDILSELQFELMSDREKPQDFTSNFIKLKKDLNLRNMIIEENLERVKKFSTTSVTQTYLSLLN